MSLPDLEQLLAPDPHPDPIRELEALAKSFLPTKAPTQAPTVAKRATTSGPGGTEWVNLADLNIDHVGGTQRPPDREKIAGMVEHLRAGGKLPPLKVNRRPDGSLWLTDGQHRAAAGLICGVKRAQAEVTHLPSQEEAQEVNIIAKVAPDDNAPTCERLLGAGAERLDDGLVLDLGKSGRVIYLPHDELVDEPDRGQLQILAPNAQRVLKRLGLSVT